MSKWRWVINTLPEDWDQATEPTAVILFADSVEEAEQKAMNITGNRFIKILQVKEVD